MKKTLGFAFRHYPAQVLGIFALGIAIAVSEGIGIGLLLPIIEGLDSPSNPEASHPMSKFFRTVILFIDLPFTVWSMFIMGITMISIQAVLQYLKANLVAKTGNRVQSDIRTGLFASYLDTQIAYFNRKKTGDLASGVVLESLRAGTSFQHLVNSLVAGALVIAYLALAFLISWKLSCLTSVLLVSFIALMRLRHLVRRRGAEISRANDALENRTVEYLLAMREVKSFGLEGQVKEMFKEVANNVAKHNWLFERLTARFRLLYEEMAVLVILIIIGLAYFWLDVQISSIAAFLAVLFRLMPRATTFQDTLNKFLGNYSGFETVNSLMQEAEEYRLPNSSVVIDYDAIDRDIQFKKVSFSYEGSNSSALRSVDICFVRGESTAIVGASGAGKSTLADLIVRFYDPDEGQVLVDDIDLREIDIKVWRSIIGFVHQDTFLFNDTVLKNIWYGNPEASDEEVVKAAKLARAHEFIVTLSDGYQTIIGDRGSNLSGGERQRLALARALVRDPQILILDEATSDLDSKSQHLIRESLREMKGQRTIITIAHRLSTLEDADTIVVLGNGEVLEKGTHHELLREQGHYAEYYNLEFGNPTITG